MTYLSPSPGDGPDRPEALHEHDPPREPAPPGASGARPERGARGARRWRSGELAGVLGLLLVLVSMAASIVHYVETHPKISYLDEVGNGDYLYKASHGRIARQGERLGPDIVRELSCRDGVESWNPPVDLPCPGSGDLADVPGQDHTNSDIHPPTYYWITAGLGRLVLTVAPFDSLLTAGRLVSILWFGLGIVLLYVLLKDVGVRVSARLAVCLIIALAPTMIRHMSIVNVTATTFAAGALLVLAAVRWERRRWPLAALLGAAALGVALKADNLVPILAVCTYLLVRAAVVARSGRTANATTAPAADDGAERSTGREGWRPYVVATVATGAAAVVVEVTWLLIRQALAVGDALDNPGTALFYRTDLRPDDLLSQLAAFVLPLGPVGAGSPFTAFTGLLLVGAYVGAVLYRRPQDPAHSWGVAVTVAVVAGGPLLVVGTYLASSIIFPIPQRYGFGLLVPMGMLLGLTLRNRVAAVAVAAVGVALLLVGGVTPPQRADVKPPARSATSVDPHRARAFEAAGPPGARTAPGRVNGPWQVGDPRSISP